MYLFGTAIWYDSGIDLELCFIAISQMDCGWISRFRVFWWLVQKIVVAEL
jgi:hypothetical protein